MTLTTEEYHEHSDCYDGYCTKCDAITRDGDTEPDAENYKCPECGNMSCMGIEQALLCGHLEIEEWNV